jgi:hypothetical protein
MGDRKLLAINFAQGNPKNSAHQIVTTGHTEAAMGMMRPSSCVQHARSRSDYSETIARWRITLWVQVNAPDFSKIGRMNFPQKLSFISTLCWINTIRREVIGDGFMSVNQKIRLNLFP